jgi:hypothetical protein
LVDANRLRIKHSQGSWIVPMTTRKIDDTFGIRIDLFAGQSGGALIMEMWSLPESMISKIKKCTEPGVEFELNL